MILDIIIANGFNSPRRSTSSGNNGTFKVNNTKVVGNNNKIIGDNNIVIGNNNDVYGDNNTITGNNNDVYGTDNSIKSGNNNTVHENTGRVAPPPPPPSRVIKEGEKPSKPPKVDKGKMLTRKQLMIMRSMTRGENKFSNVEFKNAGRKWDLGGIELDDDLYSELEKYMKKYEQDS